MVKEWPEVNQLATRFEKVVNMRKLAQAQRTGKFHFGTTHIRDDV